MADESKPTDVVPAAPEEVYESLRSTRTTHPATTYRHRGVDESMSVQLPMSGNGYSPNNVGGAVLGEGETRALAAERVASGVTQVDLRNELAAIDRRRSYLQDELGRSLPSPHGGVIHMRSPTERAELQRELDSLEESRAVALVALQGAAQRDAVRAAKLQRDVESEAALEEFANGNPQRRAAAKQALLELEAKNFAEWLYIRKHTR